jgi:YD repeat-containing protein
LLLAQAQPSGRIVEYSYDALGRPVSLGYRASAEDPLRMLEQFAYAGPDRLARVTRANGVQTDYAYSGLAGVPNAPGDFGWGQIQGVRHARDGVPAIAAFTFAHDRNQNKTLRALTEPFVPGGPTNLQAFVYDSLDRLVHAVTATNGATARDTTYVLDPMGNRLSVIRDGADQLYTLDPALPTPGDFQVNQYTETPLDARQYDENGNLWQTVAPSPVGPVTNAFIYDYADRLVAVQGASGPVAAYAYDALGRRIAKIVYAGLPPAPALTNRYLYADGQVIEEEDGGGAVLRTYAMPHVFDQKGRVSVTGGGVVLFHHCDDQGSLLALTDEKGRVVERFDYDDYGAPVFLDPEGLPRAGATASLTGVPYLFHGMLWDDETGLHLAQGRGGGVNDNGCVLDPNTGSTLSRTHAAPHVFETKGRTYADSNPYSLKKEEGGRHTPFHNKYGASRTTDVTGEIVLMDGRSLAMSYAGIGGINGGMPNRISMNVTVAKQTQGATFGEKVNAGLHAAGGALAQGASRAKGTVKFFNDAKGFGRTGGAGTKAQDHNSSRSNKTSSRVDFGGGGSTFDGFPVRYVFPKTRASSGGGDPTDLRVRFVVKI